MAIHTHNTSKKAQEFVSKKIKILMGEGMKREQAIAVALGMARKRGFKVPKGDGFKRKVDNKMNGFGDIDLEKKVIRVNKKRNKKHGGVGELIDTIVHEENHRKHPKMKEKEIRNKTKKDLKKMSLKQKAKFRNRFNKMKKAESNFAKNLLKGR